MGLKSVKAGQYFFIPKCAALIHDHPMTLWRVRLPLLLAAGDLLWMLSALAPHAEKNPAASVGMLKSTVWIFLHLPAVFLGGLPFEAAGQAAGPLPRSEVLLIGALALAQAAALGWAAGWILDRKRKA